MKLALTWPMYLRNQLGVDGFAVQLSATQMRLVSILMLRRGQSINRHELIELMWPNPDDEPDYAQNVIEHMKCRTNLKIPGLITARRRFGYMIEKEI